MNSHQSIFVLWLLISLGIALLFFYVYLSTFFYNKDPQHNVAKRKSKRRRLLLTLVVISILIIGITMPNVPYFKYARNIPSKVVYVVGRQYQFIMSEKAIDLKNPMPESITIPRNEVVEFRVTSLDVNHGFAIFNDKNELVAQTQAMPGYVNRLRWKFEEPGTYNIFCLEFCGTGHPFMRASFTVK